jgi:hypothetical protein
VLVWIVCGIVCPVRGLPNSARAPGAYDLFVVLCVCEDPARILKVDCRIVLRLELIGLTRPFLVEPVTEKTGL